jgi:short-subunit dehydrogenase
MKDFKQVYGPWALVAGASEGLGAAFAEALARRGLNLVLMARRKEKLEDFARNLHVTYAVEVRHKSLDLADHQGTAKYLSELDLDIGLLVYNAAFSPIGYFANIPQPDLNRVIDVNIKAPLFLIKVLSGPMLERGRGGIILMSSLSGMQGSPKIATYAASKAFNMTLAEGLWSEFRKQGVDVLACCAGAVRTPGYRQAQVREAPGTMDADKVAEETLRALGNGPTVIPGALNKFFSFIMRRILSRKSAIAIMEKNTRDLS